MTWPEPCPGLVIRYSYLWKDEAVRGHEDGRKDRPCAIVLAVAAEGQSRRVIVLPITHAMPNETDAALELPAPVKLRLGLDAGRSWVVASEANVFLWPGPDLRPVDSATGRMSYGMLPPRLTRALQQMVVLRARKGRLGLTPRN